MQNWQTCFCIFPVFARHRRDITQPNMEIFESFLPPFSQPGRVMACMRALDGLLRHIKIRATMSSQRHTHKAIIMVHVNLVPYYQEHTHTQYTVGMEMLWWIWQSSYNCTNQSIISFIHSFIIIRSSITANGWIQKRKKNNNKYIENEIYLLSRNELYHDQVGGTRQQCNLFSQCVVDVCARACMHPPVYPVAEHTCTQNVMRVRIGYYFYNSIV